MFGDKHCNDMFSSNVCKGGSVDSQWDTGKGTCWCERPARGNSLEPVCTKLLLRQAFCILFSAQAAEFDGEGNGSQLNTSEKTQTELKT